ncbi:MAG: hypothetical protein HY718_00215, partial [Planctomycetes bacterium]|nr:hypothetical protein [Planctomycetota bacterium]
MHPVRAKCVVLTAALVAAPAWAVKPAAWTHEQPKDFLAGEAKNVVISSQGEVMLSRDAKLLLDADKEAGTVNALAQAEDGNIYAATGPNGHIYRVSGEQATKFATLPDGNVFSLVFAKDGRLLAGTGGGEKARIHAIAPDGKVSVFSEPKDAKYVWSLARGAKGEIYAATGTEGQLFVIDADGKNAKVLADLKPKNLLCMAFGNDGMIYVGTDEDGLVYRINPTTGKPYVMYDAGEAEISALAIDAEGNLYAATAAADQARPGRTVADKPGGKPEPAKDAKEGTKPSTAQPAGDKKEGAAKDSDSEKDKDKTEAGEAEPAKKEPKDEKPAAGGPKLSIAQILATRGAGATRPTAQGAASVTTAPGGGNAIYRIDVFGFVTEVFREPVVILDLAEADGTLYAATGNEGRIYAVTPREDRKAMIVKLDSAQVTSLLHLDDGQLVTGSANAPKITRISKGYAPKGTLTSKALDAGQIVKWGRIKWDAGVPTGTHLTVATRTGNVSDEESDAWDEWSPEMDATMSQQIASPGARFLQYRLTFEATDTTKTARLTRLNVARIEENRPPLISSLDVLSVVEEAKKPTSSPKVKQMAGAATYGDPDAPVPQYHYVVKWTAEDPNQDSLMYEVFYRQAGQARWIRIAKELKEPLHIWDGRTVPDARYELRVVADDRAANPPGTELQDARISDPVIIDNTPPQVRVLRVEKLGKTGVRLHA